METLSITLLRQARKEKELSLKEVSDLVNKHWSTISRYENGELEISVDMLEQLIKLYDTSVADVFINTEEDKENEDI